MRLPISALDVRHVLRGFRGSPLFTAVTLLTLAVAIGANAAIFSLVDQALLRPLPYDEPGRLVAVWADWSERGAKREDYTNPEDFYDWREQSRSIADMAAYTGTRQAFTGRGEPRQLAGGAVTQTFFEVLGVRFAAGRGFAPGEDIPKGPDVAVISHALWQSEFGGDPSILDQAITLNGEPTSIIGVLPADFAFPFLAGGDVWTPLQTERTGRGNAYLRVVGRLAPGETVAFATLDMSALAARLEHQYPESNRDIGAYVQPLQDAAVADVRQRLLVLWAATGFLLLIACVNIANLLLVRAVGRTREMAVRGALGAGRGRLMSLVILESVLLAAGGALLGLLLAMFAVRGMHGQLPDGIRSVVDPGIDLRVFIIATAATLVTGTVFGLLPAMRTGRVSSACALGGGERSGSAPSTGRLRFGFVVANFALALTLTVGAGLFAKSLLHLESVDPGFRADGVLTATVSFPDTSYPDDQALRTVHDALRTKLDALPGVSAAGFTHTLPLAGANNDTSVFIEGKPTERPDGTAHVWFSIVTPGFLDGLRVRPLQGRVFTEHDHQVRADNVIVNEAFVRQYLAGAEPIGTRITAGTPAEGEWMTVVGVVDDVRFFGMDAEQTPAMYLPMHKYPSRNIYLTLCGGSDPLLLARPLREAVASLDPGLALGDIQPMTALVDTSLQPARSVAFLISSFAGAALFIAIIGVYGSISYAVSQRRREFGVRMALGASGSSVLHMVLRQGVTMALAGILIGVALTGISSRGIRSLLYQVSPMDPGIVIGVAVLLLTVAVAATLIPAWRAARTQPMRVLREE
jgi:putative ABC transport system permease protein